MEMLSGYVAEDITFNMKGGYYYPVTVEVCDIAETITVTLWKEEEVTKCSPGNNTNRTEGT